MEINEAAIRALVEQVVARLQTPGGAAAAPAPAVTQGGALAGQAGVFGDIESAVRAARKAFEDLMGCTLETRRRMIAAMRETGLAHLEEIARLAVEETGMGRAEDKVLKNRIAITATPGVEDLVPVSFTDDHGLTLVERAPYGVVGSITPSTNPTETIFNNAIGMVAAGNAVVFNAHPAARKVSARTVSILNEAIQRAGGPANVVCTVAEPTIETAQKLFESPLVNLLVVTGGPAVVRAAMKSAKKVIAAGPGGIYRTVGIIFASDQLAEIDNYISEWEDYRARCEATLEEEAQDLGPSDLKAQMKKHGAFELNAEQTAAVTRLVIKEAGGPGREGAANKDFVGKDAGLIARAIGVEVPPGTRLLLCEVGRDHPLVWTEQLMPVLPLVRLANVDEAIELAVACEHGFRHTAVMHSRNIEKLSKMAKVMNCSLFVKNGSAYNGLGFGGAGFTSWTIASPTGEGLTRATTFSRERRCALIDCFRIV